MQSVFEQDLERLVKQYDQPVPRYTSYPTVPVWPQGSFGREYAEALEAEGTKDRGISIYLHIPFCRTLCTFCGCNKVITRDAELVERYLKALEQEMTAVAKGLGQRKTLSQLPPWWRHPNLPQFRPADQADQDAEASLRN